MMALPGIPQPVPSPALMLGMVTVNDDGEVAGSGTLSLGGQILPYEQAGTVVMNDDCTAVLESTATSGSLADAGKSWLVVFGGGEELWAIQTESQMAKPVIAGVWKRLGAFGWLER